MRWLKKPVALWVTVVVGLAGVAIGAAANPKDKKVSVAAVETTTTTSTTAPPTTTTTTTAPTTTTTTAPAQPVVVMEASGSNKTTTDNFTVFGTWKITADVSGGAGINVTIKTTGGQTVDFISFDKSGESQKRGTGTFYLEISPYGATYHVVVTDIPG